MLNFPKIPKIALRKFSELTHTLWRSKRDFRVKLTFFWVALHILNCWKGLRLRGKPQGADPAIMQCHTVLIIF